MLPNQPADFRVALPVVFRSERLQQLQLHGQQGLARIDKRIREFPVVIRRVPGCQGLGNPKVYLVKQVAHIGVHPVALLLPGARAEMIPLHVRKHVAVGR